MDVYVGFDPGGIGAFGWAVVSIDALPMRIMGHGVLSHAERAFGAAVKCAGERIDGVGIDAPLFWSLAGDRNAGQRVRRAITKLGAPGGTVGHVNALRGACLIQGMLVALRCREKLGRVPITESHPKALLWLTGKATKKQRPDVVTFDDLVDCVSFDGAGALTDHERDATLGAVAAFSAVSNKNGWRDLYLLETNPVTPLNPPPAYWMPI
jgi:hypothetical protein